MHVSILGWNIFLGIVSQKGKWVGGGLERLHYLTTFMFLFDTSRGGQLCFSQLCLLAHGTVLEINLSNTAKLSRNVTCVRYIILSDWMKFQMSSSFFFFLFFIICIQSVHEQSLEFIGPSKYFILFYDHEIQDGHIHRHFDHLSIDTKMIFSPRLQI